MSIQPGVYRIQNQKSGTYFDASVNNRGEIHGWENRPQNNNQRWNVERSGQGYRLKNAEFNDYAGVHGYEDGNKVVLSGNHNEWDIQDRGNGANAITLVGTQQCIDLDRGHSANGAHISIWCLRDAEQQHWRFERVGDLPGGGGEADYGSGYARGGGDQQGGGGGGYQQGGGGGYQQGGGQQQQPQQPQQPVQKYTGAVPPGLYFVENAASGTAADLAGAGTAEGTPITGWGCNRGQNQTWDLVPAQNGYYFNNLASGTYLGFESGGGGEGTIIHGSLNPVEWQVNQASQGYSVHLASNSSIVLDLAGGGNKDGVPICLYSNHNGPNQQWKFTQIPQ